MTERLTLKWGTPKGWKLTPGGPAYDALSRYADMGMSYSAMMQHDTPEQKAVICELIDALDAETVYLNWDDKEVTKDEAKQYVMNYRGQDDGG